MEERRAVPGVHTDEYLRRACQTMGGRSELVVYGFSHPVCLSVNLVSFSHYLNSIATDLNLHQLPTTKPTNEKQEREILNRIRVWQICFNLDRSTATQFGKPSTIKEDSIIRHSADWYKKSPYNVDYDVHMCGYTALLRIVARFHDEVFAEGSGLSSLKRVDFRDVTIRYDRELEAFKEEWEGRFNAVGGDRGAEFRCKLLPL